MEVPSQIMTGFFANLGVPEEKAIKTFAYVERFPSLFAKVEPLYLRREETECPFTLQVGNGRVFALLKSKVGASQCQGVKKAVEIKTGEVFAQYVFNLTHMAKEQSVTLEEVVKKIHLQFERLKKFSDLSPVASIEYLEKNRAGWGSNKTLDYKFSVIVPLANGNVQRVRQSLSVADVKALFLEVAQTLATMHEEGFVHRNIKASTILLFGKSAKLVGYKLTKGEASFEEKKGDLHQFALTLFDILHPGRWSVIERDNAQPMKELYRVVQVNTRQPQYGDVEKLILRMLLGSGRTEGSPQMVRRQYQPIETIQEFIEEFQKENF